MMIRTNSKDLQPVYLQLGEAAAAVEIDLSIYSLPAVLRTCYKFTDHYYLFLSREASAPGNVVVTFGSKVTSEPAREFLGDFLNELIDQQIREQLAAEAGPLRELIAAQAFSEGNLLDADQDSLDYNSDPLEIGGR